MIWMSLKIIQKCSVTVLQNCFVKTWIMQKRVVPTPTKNLDTVFLKSYRIWYDIVQKLKRIAVHSTFFSMFFFTACQQSCGKVMFLFMFVCPQGGPQVTITHDVSDLTIQGPKPPYPRTSDMGSLPGPALPPPSNLFTWGPQPPPILTSGGHWSTYV